MSKNQSSDIPKPKVPEKGNFLLSLVIPCYNESARIDIMLSGLAEFNEKWTGDFEVIIVDDGSKDDTANKVRQAVDTKYSFLKDKIKIEQLPANKGKGGALKKGVSLAQGDYILTLDADMSTRPTELINWQKKVKTLFTEKDTIYIGARRHKEGKVEGLRSREIMGSIFNGIVQILTSLHHQDTQCGFKLYPKDVGHFLFGNMQSNGWAHDVELLYQADLNDCKIIDMPINWVNQPDSKVHVIRDSFMMFWGVLTIALRIWFYNIFLLPFRMHASVTSEQRKHIIYRAIFNAMAVLLVIVMPVMSFQYAVTGDEHVHYEYGTSIFNYFFHGDNYAQQVVPTAAQFYGGLFDFITGFTYHVFHFWTHYTTMHFMNALVGAFGIIYAGKLAKLLGGWNAGVLAMIFLILSPSWFGHNFDNPKDIPFSVGYTAGVYFILLFLKALPAPGTKHVFGLVCGIGWALGVRIGGLLLIGYLVMFTVFFALFTQQLKAVLNRRLIIQVAIACAGGYLAGIALWPYAHLDIIGKPMEVLKVMSNFFVDIAILYDGKKILSSQVPWYYIPRYVLYTAPIVVLVGAVIGTVGLPVIFRKDRRLLLFALFVLFTCVFPVAYAVYKKSSLYDGWRHFLFIYPPLVIISCAGWTALVNSRQKAIRFATMGLIVIGLLSPARFAVANHTFEALYYNEIAGGLKGVYGRYETDYYMLGIKPATEWLMKNEHIEPGKTLIATNCTFPMVSYIYDAAYKKLPKKYDEIYERYADFRHDSVYESYAAKYPDFKNIYQVSNVYVRYYERYSKDWDYCILFSRTVDASELISGNWPPPETIHTITVDGVPIAAVLKRKTKKDLVGFQLLKEKRVEEAKAMFEAALVEYPNNNLVWEAMAEIYDAMGKPDSVLYAGSKCLATYPGDISVYQMIGSAYVKLRQPEKAITLYKELAKYNESYSHFFLAIAAASSGNVQQAFMEVDNAIDADPYNQQAYKLAAQMAQQTKNQARVDEYYEKYKKAFPEKE